MTSINFGKGLFRLWVVLAVCWIAVNLWLDPIKLGPPEHTIARGPDGSRFSFAFDADYQTIKDALSKHYGKPVTFTMPVEFDPFSSIPIPLQPFFAVVTKLILPPFLLLLLGLAGGWVLRGFSRNENQQGQQ